MRKFVDKMIGLSKRGDLHARRQALGWVYDKDLVAALFEQAPERYEDGLEGFGSRGGRSRGEDQGRVGRWKSSVSEGEGPPGRGAEGALPAPSSNPVLPNVSPLLFARVAA